MGINPTATPPPRAEPPRRRPGRPVGSTAGRSVRRGEYLEAIIDAIRRIGPEATLAELAAGAGMSKPVLYDHFTDRLGLTAAVVGELVQNVAADALLAVLSGGEPEELLAKAFDVFVAFVEQEPQIYGWVLRGVRELPAAGLSELPMAMAAGNNLSMVIGSVMRGAGVDSGAAEPWAFGIVGFVLSATEWWLIRRSMSRSDFVDYLAKFVWGGLSSSGVERINVAAVLSALPAVIEAAQAVVDSPELHPQAPPKGKRS
ncbi:MAG TPA: TetR/AcrR family transcriptional regulator [Sporichthyaceae bacterium]|nr:TetR/AcrR family transcriptional regulator [Sporichthyaceae bacterium]